MLAVVATSYEQEAGQGQDEFDDEDEDEDEDVSANHPCQPTIIHGTKSRSNPFLISFVLFYLLFIHQLKLF